jgi:hypothetical protein
VTNDALPTAYRGKRPTRSAPGVSESEPAHGPDGGGASAPGLVSMRRNGWLVATSVAAAPAHGWERACSILPTKVF